MFTKLLKIPIFKISTKKDKNHVYDHSEETDESYEVRYRSRDSKTRRRDSQDRLRSLRTFSQEEALAYDGILVPVIVSVWRVLTVEHVGRGIED